MTIEVLADPESVAQRAASVIALEARQAIAARELFTLAVSGGHTPWRMLRVLADMALPWDAVRIFQVDERVAPEGHADRNLTHLRESLAGTPIRTEQIYAMPVESLVLESAAGCYASLLRRVAGEPPVIDLVHLGLGPDGHTASLVPGDPILHVDQEDVALSGPYQGRLRMTLTYPVLNRARRILWVVTGADKTSMVDRLLAGDQGIPAGRVSRDHALVLADCAAVPAHRSLKEGVGTCS